MSHKGGTGGNASYGTDPSDASHRDWSGCLDTHFMELVKACTLNSEDLVYGDPATAQKHRGNLHTAFAINREICARMQEKRVYLPACMPGGGEIKSPPTLANLANPNFKFSPVWYMLARPFAVRVALECMHCFGGAIKDLIDAIERLCVDERSLNQRETLNVAPIHINVELDAFMIIMALSALDSNETTSFSSDAENHSRVITLLSPQEVPMGSGLSALMSSIDQKAFDLVQFCAKDDAKSLIERALLVTALRELPQLKELKETYDQKRLINLGGTVANDVARFIFGIGAGLQGEGMYTAHAMVKATRKATSTPKSSVHVDDRHKYASQAGMAELLKEPLVQRINPAKLGRPLPRNERNALDQVTREIGAYKSDRQREQLQELLDSDIGEYDLSFGNDDAYLDKVSHIEVIGSMVKNIRLYSLQAMNTQKEDKGMSTDDVKLIFTSSHLHMKSWADDEVLNPKASLNSYASAARQSNALSGDLGQWQKRGRDSANSHNRKAGDRASKKRGLCRFFVQGTCTRGDACVYSHEKNDSGKKEKRDRDVKRVREVQEKQCPFQDLHGLCDGKHSANACTLDGEPLQSLGSRIQNYLNHRNSSNTHLFKKISGGKLGGKNGAKWVPKNKGDKKQLELDFPRWIPQSRGSGSGETKNAENNATSNSVRASAMDDDEEEEEEEEEEGEVGEVEEEEEEDEGGEGPAKRHQRSE